MFKNAYPAPGERSEALVGPDVNRNARFLAWNKAPVAAWPQEPPAATGNDFRPSSLVMRARYSPAGTPPTAPVASPRWGRFLPALAARPLMQAGGKRQPTASLRSTTEHQ